MTDSPFAEVDYLGEPVIVSHGYQLCALLAICEQAARSLNNVGDGPYRERASSSLAVTMEPAQSIATDLLVALEVSANRLGGRTDG